MCLWLMSVACSGRLLNLQILATVPPRQTAGIHAGQRGVVRERHTQTRSAIAQHGDKYWLCVAQDSAEDVTQSKRSRSLTR